MAKHPNLHPKDSLATAAIQALLHQMIASSGPLRVDQFMEIVLGHPEHGYYRRQDPFGASGDFTTAAEISGLFGEMCGIYLAHIYEMAKNPASAQIVELGPGRGSLMADMRHVWKQIMPVMTALPIHLVETSPKLRRLQKQRLGTADAVWHDDVASLPDAALFGVANEFFDALPLQQAIWRNGSWRHRLIDLNDGRFDFVDGPPLTPAEKTGWHLSSETQNRPAGTIAEFCPAAESVAAQIATRIASFGGAFLIIDYGKTDHDSDSLQAVAAHRPVDLFHEPGNADISHWVDFAALRRATNAAGARFIGPVTQADFLMSIGLRERAENTALHCDADGRRALFAAVDRLVGAHHMGTAFKVGLILPAGQGVPAGFAMGDTE